VRWGGIGRPHCWLYSIAGDFRNQERENAQSEHQTARRQEAERHRSHGARPKTHLSRARVVIHRMIRVVRKSAVISRSRVVKTPSARPSTKGAFGRPEVILGTAPPIRRRCTVKLSALNADMHFKVTDMGDMQLPWAHYSTASLTGAFWSVFCSSARNGHVDTTVASMLAGDAGNPF
jgi:hypothetical protein